MATVHRGRCGECGAFIRVRPELDDWAHEEAVYGGYEWEEHDCSGPARVGDGAPGPEHKPRGGGRPASPTAKSRARMHRFLCDCSPPIVIRHARTELAATCGVCGEAFIWSPTPREQGVVEVSSVA